jgi:hypothetical protein
MPESKPDLGKFQRAFAAGLASNDDALSPMDIYRNTVLLGAVEALQDNFPVVGALIGDEAFAALAVAHAEALPPDSPILAHYGRGFPAWLAAHPISEELPYLADVADCERLWAEALHAADAPALDLTALQAIAIDELLQLPLSLHPAARIAWHESPAIEIWLAHQDTAAPDEIAPEWQATGALFTRPQLAVAGCAIGAAEHRLLSGIGKGQCLGDAAQAVSLIHPDADIGSCFAGLVQRGVFAAINEERSSP